MHPDQGFDLTNEVKQKFENLDKRRGEKRIEDLKQVLEKPEGRRLLWELLEIAGIFHTGFNQNALSMAFTQGKREVGLVFLQRINANMPQRLYQMQNEYASDQKIEKAAREKIIRERS